MRVIDATAKAWPTGLDDSACVVCHRESCEDPTHDPQTLRFSTATHVINSPPPIEIVEGIIWAGCMTVLVAESGAGKTFVQLDLAAAISAGLPWHGRATKRGSVAYITFEGDALGLRLRALREVQGHLLDNVYILRASDPLSPRASREVSEGHSAGELAVSAALSTLVSELAESDRPPILLVVIDTVRASLSGSEDSSEHVSAYMRAVRRIIARVCSAGTLLSHHAGWQDGETQRKRERGSSAWRGNCDATLYLDAGPYDPVRGEAPLTLRTLKVRDAERPDPLHLIRRRVELAGSLSPDLRRGPLTSCVIDSDRRSREDREAEQQQAVQTAQQSVDLTVLTAMHAHPGTASLTALRNHVGLGQNIVADAVARILQTGWARKDKRTVPYEVTEAGLARLREGAK